jgi:hypothetical protein
MSVYAILCHVVSYGSEGEVGNRIENMQKANVRCTAPSSGRLSLNLFRVRLPMSLLSTRVTGSPQLRFPKSKLNREGFADVETLSRSIAIPWSGRGVGERDSGVEVKPPKLEMERGLSSDERLRLKPIVNDVQGGEMGGIGNAMGSRWSSGLWEMLMMTCGEAGRDLERERVGRAGPRKW